jgi:hypothetical protein
VKTQRRIQFVSQKFLPDIDCLVAMLALLLCLPALGETQGAVRYLRFDEVEETLRLQADSGLPGSDIQGPAVWDAWIRERDSKVRARVDRGTQDSISNFILYGTSFTSLPRVESVESAVADDGILAPAVNTRLNALAMALPTTARNERIRFIREFLARQGIARSSVETYFAGNLRRFIQEQRAYQTKLKDAENGGDTAEVFLTRGTLFETRGLSVDTSLLPNFALQETLRAMRNKGALSPASVHRIAVIGPGLDFTDKRDGYDFYPMQTVQPFAVLEAVVRLGLGNADELQVVCFDLNSAVLAHLAHLTERARSGRPYVVQLPRESRAQWSPDAVAYWEQFGEMLGSPVQPLPVPATLGGVLVRAVAIRPEYASSLQAHDLNVVAQTLDLPPGRRFDLVVATNVLVYYDRLQQALAMTNIAAMMAPGGIFLANNVLPAQHTSMLDYLGRRSMSYTPDGAYGDDVVVYRRR